MAAAGAPYLLVTHQAYCGICKRAVDEAEEAVENDDGLMVHLGCGGVLEMQGLRCPYAPGRCEGSALEFIERAAGSEADWLAEQRAILEALPGAGAARAIGSAAGGERRQGGAGAAAAAGRAAALEVLDQARAAALAAQAPRTGVSSTAAAAFSPSLSRRMPGDDEGKRRRSQIAS
eukprot:TRINITY_DN63400_c0_g1_i1.p1 TRINITY_DN63400_c0_g1~~TRINITY_DN63400_c0_g1_i1.p1  ORF type:complete len:201 (-),score=47.33 TRINITY_DN63400_c0_g1_i1:97-624(-)